MKLLKIGLLGLGQVGTGFYSMMTSKKKYFRQEIKAQLKIAKIAVKNKRRKRKIRVPQQILTQDAMSVVRDPSIDVIVELIGGTREAKKLVCEALRQGKHVVTANKALLAEHGDEIFQLAYRMKRWVFFEAAVGGGIPVMKALREGLVANRIDSIHSIINGTSNYILTQMTQEGMDFKEALVEAQARGYAEADPTFDLEGVDAAHKLAILVRFAFGGKVKFESIDSEGITRIRSEDIAFAEEFGYCIKLLAIAKRSKGGIEARVQPTLVPKSHILANVNGSFNAVLLRGDEVGDVLLYGRGAGSRPTASAVMSDVVDIAKRMSTRFKDLGLLRAVQKSLKVKNTSSILSRYYMRFHVVDKPGVLSQISQVLGKHQISISDVVQHERRQGSVVPLILITHDAHENYVRKAIRAIDRLRTIRGKSQVLRIEEAPE